MKLVSILTQRLALLALLRLILDANIFRPKLHESVFRACCVVLCFLAWLFEEDIRKAARPLMTNFCFSFRIFLMAEDHTPYWGTATIWVFSCLYLHHASYQLLDHLLYHFVPFFVLILFFYF